MAVINAVYGAPARLRTLAADIVEPLGDPAGPDASR